MEDEEMEDKEMEDNPPRKKPKLGSDEIPPNKSGDKLNQKMIKFINDYLVSLYSEGEGQGQPIKIHKSLPRSQKDYHVIISHGRTTNTSRRIPNENRKKEKYIQAILNCLQRLLLEVGKHIIEYTFSPDTFGFYILDNIVTKEGLQELLDNPEVNGQTIGSIPKAVISFGKITPSDKSGITKEHYKKIRELKKIMELDRLHVGWVNGERGGPKLLGTIAMLYGILKLVLTKDIMFGILDDDTDKHDAYGKFGYNHVDTSNPNEASADFTNFEQMINEVTKIICNEYPESCNCFADAKIEFKSAEGGKRTKKRKTKRKNSKKRKTKRRRKY